MTSSTYPKFSLKDKNILLVGSTGILGRRFASALSQTEANVVIADRPDSDVIKLSSDLAVTSTTFDVQDEDSVITGIRKSIEKLGGRVDGCIMNSAVTGESLVASGNAFADFEEYPLDLWQKVININLSGTFLVCREVGRSMKKNGGGSIVTVSSIYGVVGPDHRIYDKQPFQSFASYSASKAGVIGLTKWLSTWWGSSNIRINCLSPGGVFNNHDEAFVGAYSRRVPMNRMANQDDMTGTILFLLSDASSYCTGQNFIIDGGLSTW